MAETDGTPAAIGAYSTPIEAQIRLKGSGSFRPLGQKAAFKIKFGKNAPFLGLRKMTLNNMVQDVSMVHETLAYRVFHAMGVPASRGSYAEVWVNGVNYGLHFNIEPLDKVALEKRFGTFVDPPQHLYEGEYNADVTPDRVSLLEVDEGGEEDRSDLNALMAVNANPGGDWSVAVASHANLREMARMWVAEKYIGHVDGYAGATGTNLPNNFYLYSDQAGQFRMLPWGTDQTWVFGTTYGGAGGAMFNRCIVDPDCLALYKAVGRKALATIPQLNLGTLAKCVASRLQSWQTREPPALEPNSPQAIGEAVTATREYVAAAPKTLANYLGLPVPPSPTSGACPAYGTEAAESLEEHGEEWEGELPPEEEPEEEEPPKEEPEEEVPGEEAPPGTDGSSLPSGPVATSDSFPTPALEKSPALVLRLGRITVESRGLLVRVDAPRAGKLKLRVGDGRARACEVERRVEAGRSRVLCRPKADALHGLAGRRPWLTVWATLQTKAGAPLTSWRVVRPS
jgi:hypothetical protein